MGVIFVRLYNVDIFVLIPVRVAARSALCSVFCNVRHDVCFISVKMGAAYVNLVLINVL